MSLPLRVRVRNRVQYRGQTVIPRPAAMVPAAPAILPAAVPATRVEARVPAGMVPAEVRVTIAAPAAPDLVKPSI